MQLYLPAQQHKKIVQQLPKQNVYAEIIFCLACSFLSITSSSSFTSGIGVLKNKKATNNTMAAIAIYTYFTVSKLRSSCCGFATKK